MTAPEPRADGLLLVDKPEGPTSHDVVEAVRRVLGGARCGHAGTLDPFASGLLVIGVGKATRLLRFLSGADKSYEGSIRLGIATDTDDGTGRLLHEPRPVDFGDEALRAAVASQSGEFDQRPPGFSARKQGGVPSYRLARRGQEAPRAPSRVRVVWHECLRAEPDLLRVRVTVSAGTYIRAIARDLGETLGCGGHLESLRRTRSGAFRIEEALALPAGFATRPPRMPRRGRATTAPVAPSAGLIPRPDTGEPVLPVEAPPVAAGIPENALRTRLEASLRPLRDIPLGLGSVRLSDEEIRRIRTGGFLERGDLPAEPGYVRLLDPGGELVAIAERAAQEGMTGLLRPRIVL